MCFHWLGVSIVEFRKSNLFSTPIGSYVLDANDLSEWVLQLSKTEAGVQKSNRGG